MCTVPAGLIAAGKKYLKFAGMEPKKKVIIVGGGFAGINLAKKLDTDQFDITLLDKLNHHQFQPLFYQVATSQLEPTSISFPLRYVLKEKKEEIRIRLTKVNGVNPSSNTLRTSIGEFKYDILVLAMGCGTNFYGNEELARNALTLKTTYEAIAIRNHILCVFEKILTAPEEELEGLSNIVVVGAGPTGVELAGAFAEIRKHMLPKDYKRIDFAKLRIILVEGTKYTLNTMSEMGRKYSRKYLEEMGVEIMTETLVRNYDGINLVLSTGQTIQTRTVIWAAGIQANTIEGLPKECLERGNRIRVDRINRIQGFDNIFALGDMACMTTPKYPQGHPQLANVAINQAKNLARNLNGMSKGKEPVEFEYKDYGTMATIGENKAVVDLPFVRFRGFFAWLVWMFLHLMLILSVQNKLVIFIRWSWSYVTKNTALRIILRETE